MRHHHRFVPSIEALERLRLLATVANAISDLGSLATDLSVGLAAAPPPVVAQGLDSGVTASVDGPTIVRPWGLGIPWLPARDRMDGVTRA